MLSKNLHSQACHWASRRRSSAGGSNRRPVASGWSPFPNSRYPLRTKLMGYSFRDEECFSARRRAALVG